MDSGPPHTWVLRTSYLSFEGLEIIPAEKARARTKHREDRPAPFHATKKGEQQNARLAPRAKNNPRPPHPRENNPYPQRQACERFRTCG